MSHSSDLPFSFLAQKSIGSEEQGVHEDGDLAIEVDMGDWSSVGPHGLCWNAYAEFSFNARSIAR